MLKEKTVVFIGHSDCFGLNESALLRTLESLLEQGFCVFLNGGMGDFDWACARCLQKLRPLYPSLHHELILPYLGFSIREPAYFDEIVFPEALEGIPGVESAVADRNSGTATVTLSADVTDTVLKAAIETQGYKTL